MEERAVQDSEKKLEISEDTDCHALHETFQTPGGRGDGGDILTLTPFQLDQPSLQDLPNEVLQDIYLLSLNSDLPNTCKKLHTKLSTNYIRPQLVERLFASLRETTDTPTDRNFQALLSQSWFEPIALTMSAQDIHWWFHRDTKSARRLLEGPWIQARGNLLTRCVKENSQYFRRRVVDSIDSIDNGLQNALRVSCVPAVLALGGFDQADWAEWDAGHDVDSEWAYTAGASEPRPAERNARRQSLWETTPSQRFERRPNSIISQTGQAGGVQSPWLAFSDVGIRYTCRYFDVSSSNLLYSTRNVYRDPSLHRFVIQKTFDRWFSRQHLEGSDSIRTFIKSKNDLAAITSWMLDSVDAGERILPSGTTKMQQFYGTLVRRRVFPLELSDLGWLSIDDQKRALDGEWGLFDDERGRNIAHLRHLCASLMPDQAFH